ncbi:hypothetical protein QZH41_018723 [Actinostola sp. cb2023]|nr:hypothetical protein QZH41_018723 [Actinostola sp. cb2023]
MDENSDHEVISNPADSTSESENETNAFHGFDITDVRGILNEAKRVTLFTSAPQKIAATDSGNEDFDGKVLLETAEDYKADTNKTPSDSDSDISGELTGSLFYSTRKKPRKDEETVATISASESESDLEGEIFLDTEWSSTDENEKIQPEPEANSVSPRSKKRGKPFRKMRHLFYHQRSDQKYCCAPYAKRSCSTIEKKPFRICPACWVHKDLLPGTINIQLDNTCKENKNQFVFSFLSYLVETEVFDKIEVSFLPVGHTHIDVDQMFSRLSVAISRRGAKTYQDLLRHIRICHNQNQGEVNQEGAKPQFARIDNVYAIREWLQPCCKEMHALRDFHQFAFVRNDQGQCIIDFKPWCSGSSWDRQKWKPLGPILQELPQGIPDLIKPNFEVVGFERIKKTVEKCGEMGILNSHEVELWHDFLAEEKDYCEVYENIEAVNYNDKYHKQELQYVPCTETRWLVDDLRERKRPNCDQTVNLCDALKASEAYERGDGFLPAYTGPYRPRKETQRDVIEDQNTEDLEVGMLVALDLEQYRERPLIGVVREIMEDNILISWYGGSWSTKWSLAKKKEGRQWVEWLEEVESKYVVLFDFNFTNKGKLRLPTIRHLKDVYSMSEESEEAESDN